ncbi:hypothetical protein F6455_13375 [Proteobacteria bacterium 005FR1]|nr:hypothetical protein [Proteobacteria bacterium 005FR1]
MKYWMSLAFLTFALSAGASFAQDDFWEDGSEFWTDEELQMFETDNWVEDDFGAYDNDFVWETEDQAEFDEWYEGVEQDWAEYEDAGEAGWFDV